MSEENGKGNVPSGWNSCVSFYFPRVRIPTFNSPTRAWETGRSQTFVKELYF